MVAIYEEAGMRDDRVYDWQMSTLGEWDEYEDEMRQADLGWVGWVFLAAVVVVTVVGLWWM